ncbi:hypothetical protein SDRG_01426, partial [Saprolegnia diclina VS20]
VEGQSQLVEIPTVLIMSSETPTPDMAADESRPEYERVEKKSQVWKYIYKLKNGPEPNRRGTLCAYVCKLCADNPKTPFQDALIAIHNDNTSNGTSHLRSHHSTIHRSLFASASKKPSPQAGTPKREKKAVLKKEPVAAALRPMPIETGNGFKRILVTGGAGFLGLHLCRRLLE